MPDPESTPVSPMPIVRVDIDHHGRLTTFWVDRQGFELPSMVHFYAHAGDLLNDLSALGACDSPTDGPLVERVNRLARTVAVAPELEAAIGFIERDGEHGLVRVTSVQQGTLSKT